MRRVMANRKIKIRSVAEDYYLLLSMFRIKNKNTQRVLNECQLMGCYNVMLKIQYENRLFY